MPKDIEKKAPRSMPPLVLSDAAAQHAREAFGPEALEAAAQDAAKQAGNSRTLAPPVNLQQPTAASGAETVRARPTMPAPARERPSEVPAPAEPLQKTTIRIDAPTKKYLRRFRRAPYRVAETLVAEYALEQLFAHESMEAIVERLRAQGHGLRRSPTDTAERSPMSVYVTADLTERLNTLRDDFNLAQGTVGAHAIDWLRARQTEEQIAAELRARGHGMYRALRTLAS